MYKVHVKESLEAKYFFHKPDGKWVGQTTDHKAEPHNHIRSFDELESFLFACEFIIGTRFDQLRFLSGI